MTKSMTEERIDHEAIRRELPKRHADLETWAPDTPLVIQYALRGALQTIDALLVESTEQRKREERLREAARRMCAEFNIPHTDAELELVMAYKALASPTKDEGVRWAYCSKCGMPEVCDDPDCPAKDEGGRRTLRKAEWDSEGKPIFGDDPRHSANEGGDETGGEGG